ncbi:pre-mRNA-processing factor 39 isoform X1 [Selaginella moellendorffii]|uniref:pre-mRNA-processing factor 39 isoform X1 n=1 Tax=Selaginella moellendorffii TaxID=88036 RepID=UPI000D1C588A|nr:pre-mRNA-processing factor 39 isoform X1 [Selaginella moellendorffii]|eukprot:XP_024519001.1 pre-mRNA-processing factor 39 isoform X1 [Selaginella moellendorffii]
MGALLLLCFGGQARRSRSAEELSSYFKCFSPEGRLAKRFEHGFPFLVRPRIQSFRFSHVLSGLVAFLFASWQHTFKLVPSAIAVNTTGVVGRLFERGLSHVGTDYLAHQLWDKYIDFEYSHSNWVGITQLYTRILQIALQALDRYFSHFKELANNRPIAELKGPEDSAEADNTVPEQIDKAGADETAEAPKDPEVERFIRRREELYKSTKEWDAKVREYETAIRRPYFHVKPLDDLQLLNWHRYLDFLEKEGDFDKIVKAYERCVIACANYPEYWIRYIHTMEAKSRSEIADDALDRALHIFVKRRPEIHIYAARFKERREDAAGARKEYSVLSSEIAPGLLEVISKHANFEKRQGNIDGACAIYESALEVEKAKEESRVLSFLYIQYIRFLSEAGLSGKSKEILALALEKLPNSKVILEAAIHFETLSPEKDIPKLEAIIERAILSSGSDAALQSSDREEISSLFLEFLDSYGTVEDCKRAELRHRQAFLYSRSSDSKKRSSLDSAVSDRSKLVKTGSNAVAGYTNGQAQWSYQNWQQPQQQWNQAYPATDYNYSSYPQQPQTAQSYAGYPQAYQQQDGNWTASAW